MTKTQVVAELATKVGTTKSTVDELFGELYTMAARELKSGRALTIPGLVKITLVRKAATPARPGRNPATGATITIKAKPARSVVKVRALKSLKEIL